MNGRHSEQSMRAWGPTAAAAAVACLPPVALAAGLSGAGFGLALDSTPLAASGAVAATVGIVAQRSAGRRLRRRLRQERARNRLEVHDLHLRLEQATRHLAEAVALAEAATRAMSGAPLVLAQHGQAVLDAAAAASTAPAEPVAVPVAAPPVAEPVLAAVEPGETVPVAAPVAAPVAVPVAAPVSPVAVPAASAAAPAEEALPLLPRRVAATAVRAEHDADAARDNADLAGRVAARLAGPVGVFGDVVVPATPADLFTPANGLPIPGGEHDWFAPARPGGLPPAPPSPPVGIAVAAAGARPAALVGAAAGSGRPPGQREPVSGPIALGADRLPARLADARVVDLSMLATPQEPALIVVRRGRHAAEHAAEHVA